MKTRLGFIIIASLFIVGAATSEKPVSEISLEEARSLAQVYLDAVGVERLMHITCLMGVAVRTSVKDTPRNCDASPRECCEEMLRECIEEHGEYPSVDRYQVDLAELPTCAANVDTGEVEACLAAQGRRFAEVGGLLTCENLLEPSPPGFQPPADPPECTAIETKCPGLLKSLNFPRKRSSADVRPRA
jgi:hypothetical protein